MANQNFRVKKGLEVGLGGTSLFADVSGVGIGSTTPRRELDVRGKGVIDELDVGIGTTSQAITVTGFSTFNGNMLVDGDVHPPGVRSDGVTGSPVSVTNGVVDVCRYPVGNVVL